MDWSSIIKQLKEGKNDALGEFYKDHSDFCINKLIKENQCNQEDASDIFVEAIMSLREKLIGDKLDNVLNIRGYLYKTCHYMLLNRLDQSAKRQKKIPDIERFYYDSVYHQTQDPSYDPELLKISQQAWNYLSERCKDILNYFYIEKLDMSQISNLMELSNANVAKTTKSRCYKKFVEKAHELKLALEKTVKN